MPLEWTIQPFVGLGQLKFGMSRGQIRQLLDEVPTSFKKTLLSASLTDSYAGHGFHLYYDENDALIYIEAFQECDVEFRGMRFHKKPLSQVLSEAGEQSMPYRQEPLHESCFFDDFGFVLYVPEDIVDAVGIFKRGYYDEP